jgi:hypothetical protein
MLRTSRACIVAALIALSGTPLAGDDANFRLTVLIEMNWDEGDMYRTYFGTVDLDLRLSTGSDSAYVEYVEGYMADHPGEQVPEFMGTVSGSGELPIEGSGTSGDVSMTYGGTASVTVNGDFIIHPELGDVLDLVLSGTTNEVWTVHTPDGDITMPQTAPITPLSLVFRYGNDEIEMTEPWDEGTTREVFSLVLMNDPFTDPEYEGPLPGEH